MGDMVSTGLWSIVPPLIAIILALITKEVFSSLLVGVFSGMVIYSCFAQTSFISAITNESISVQVPVLKRKTVPVVIKNLPDKLRYNLNTEQIEIAGNEEMIETISQIDGYINDYNAQDENASYTVTLKLPEEVILTEEKTVKLYVID